MHFSALFLLLLAYLSYLAIIAYFKPKFGLFLIILTRPCLDMFTDEKILSIGGFGLNFASILAVIVLIFAFTAAVRNRTKLKNLPFLKNWTVFLLIALASCLISINVAASITEWIRLLSIFALFILGYLLSGDEKDMEKYLLGIALSAAIPVSFAFYQYFTNSGISLPFEGIYNRIYGTFAHPNLFAYYLLIPVSALIYLSLRPDKKFPLSQFLLLIPFYIAALILTYTRGAWLAFLIIIFIIGIFKYRKFLIVAAAAVLICFFLIEPIQARVLNLFSGQYSSVSWRLELWQDSLSYAQAKPLLGYGTGTADDVILEKRGYQAGSSDPHNDYLKILLENGFLGLIAYLILIFSLCIKLLYGYLKAQDDNIKSLSLIILALTISFYIMSFADNIIRNTALQWSYWMMTGMIINRLRLTKTPDFVILNEPDNSSKRAN